MFKRRKRGGKIKFMRVRGTTAFPDQTVVKLKYSQLKNYGVLGTAHHNDIFSLNSVWDPSNVGGVSPPQPLAFDQYAQFYDSYEVRASKIIVRPVLPGDQSMKMIVYPSNSSGALTQLPAVQELPYTRSRWVNNTNYAMMRPVMNYITCRKLEGRKLDPHRYGASVAGNP